MSQHKQKRSSKYKKTAPKRTWQPKTKTPKRVRSGMRAAAHLSVPVVRLQTPLRVVPFSGSTTIREAFKNAKVSQFSQSMLKVVMRALERGTGTFKTTGWKVTNRSTRSVKRRR